MKDIYLNLNVNTKNDNAVSLSKCFVSTLKQYKTKESCPKKIIHDCLELSYRLFDIKSKSYKSSDNTLCKICNMKINNKMFKNTLKCSCSFHYKCLKTYHLRSSHSKYCPICSY